MVISAHLTGALQLLQRSIRRLRQLGPESLMIAAALLIVLVSRLLPASYFNALDRVLGRPGDGVLLLLAILLVALYVQISRTRNVSAHGVLGAMLSEPGTGLLDIHLGLDQDIDHKLSEVIDDTEKSALEIIQNVRRLFDTASDLVNYLDKSNLKGGDLEQEIMASVDCIVDIGHFVEQMPAKIARELHNVHSIVAEINDLDGLVQAVRDISLQSHLLALNASIEASRAGASGAAFRAVAAEMRVLASNSGLVAKKINDGLSRTQHVINNGIAANIATSSQELEQVAYAVTAIKKIQDNFQDIRQYYKTRFTVVTKHNVDLAQNIGDVLGSIQYQDVVRQCVDRIRVAIARRNLFLEETVDMIEAGTDTQFLLQLPALLELIRHEYAQEEHKHKHSARHDNSVGTELKIELF